MTDRKSRVLDDGEEGAACREWGSNGADVPLRLTSVKRSEVSSVMRNRIVRVIMTSCQLWHRRRASEFQLENWLHPAIVHPSKRAVVRSRSNQNCYTDDPIRNAKHALLKATCWEPSGMFWSRTREVPFPCFLCFIPWIPGTKAKKNNTKFF